VGSISSIPIWWARRAGWVDPYYFKFGAFFLIGFVIIAIVYSMAFFFNRGRFWDKFFGLLWQLPLFLSVSMGLALHNALAVWQGLRGKRTAFVRTPKFNLEIRGNAWQTNSYIHFNIPWT